MLKIIHSIEDVAIVEDDDEQYTSFTKKDYIQSVFLGIQVGFLSIPLEIIRAIVIPVFEGIYHVIYMILSSLYYGFTGRLILTKDIE